jgi:hypothetical protein
MNEHEIERIAAAMHQLRPDWPAASLRTLIAKSLMDRPRRDVAVALAWVACESGTATPARVLETGPWWKAAGVEGTTSPRQPFDPGENCAVCSLPPNKCRAHALPDHEYVTAAEHARQAAKANPPAALRAALNPSAALAATKETP